MRFLKLIIVFLLSVVILVVGIMFTIHNTEKVSIDLVFITLPEASLSLWLIAAFVLGGLLGFMLSTVAVVALKARLMGSQRKINATSKELDQLRTASLKDAA
ncbi:putative membrane protein [Neptunomonas qingdaonensis]|uniref:Putative membrane protein n=2 Tax=Neptunomonas qingdaonensis TaxID=1045558 RepID=A0A1I2MNV1_9GAMM|nr:putative membrane protein [Neptunomonas qingdaonensis]